MLTRRRRLNGIEQLERKDLFAGILGGGHSGDTQTSIGIVAGGQPGDTQSSFIGCPDPGDSQTSFAGTVLNGA